MNPNRGENIEINTGVEYSGDAQHEEGDTGSEKVVTSPESSPSKQTTAPAVQAVPTDLPIVQNPVIPGSDDDEDTQKVASTTKDTNPDRIDKVWIDKAKSIIYQTKDDPYARKTEVSKVKADYIKSRFNKILKTEE